MCMSGEKKLFKKLIPFCWLCAVVFVQSCSKSNAPVNSADVMFVNGCVSASSVSAKANSVSVSGATDIGYLANSGYQYVTAGYGVNLTFFLGITGQPLANLAENLVAAGHYRADAFGDK